MSKLLLIGVFGALGAMSRAGLSMWLNPAAGAVEVPAGTLMVNILGSFILGLLTGLTMTSSRLPEVWRAPLTTGFLGSFTTFSTFSVETARLAEVGAWRLVGVNLLLQILVGLLAATAGLAIGRAIGRSLGG